MAPPNGRQLPSMPSRGVPSPLAPAGIAAATRKSYDDLKKGVHAKLVDRIRPEMLRLDNLDDTKRQLRPAIQKLIEDEGSLMTQMDRDRLTEEILNEVLGLGPLETLLRDSSIGEIMVNGPKHVWVERRGKLEKTTGLGQCPPPSNHRPNRLQGGRRVGARRFATLTDGSRVNVIIPPLALDGPAVCIQVLAASPQITDLLNSAITPK